MLWLEGNFDGDPDIDPGDYNRLASNFSPAGYGAAAAVPEPTSLCLLLAGLLVLAHFYRNGISTRFHVKINIGKVGQP